MNELLEKWEEQFKKGQLTLWVLLSLLDGDKSVDEISQHIKDITSEHYSFDEQSIYRSMRNYAKLGLVVSNAEASSKGPDKNIFRITTKGKNLLGEFYKRNLQIFSTKQFTHLLTKINV